jgi:hypothetical protein
MLNHLVGDFAIDYSVVSLTISHNFLLSSADRSPPIFYIQKRCPSLDYILIIP